LVPKWKAQAIVSFNKIEMEREIHAVVCREKEREKEMEREIHAVKMQMKEEQLQMTDRMARLELSLQYERKESLRAKGLLTGRGVLEFALKLVHHERKLQKNFNAQRTCNSLDDESPHVNTDAWKLQQCYEEMCRQHPGARLSEKSIGKAFEYVYGVLSHEIHGYPWSDESVVLLLILMLILMLIFDSMTPPVSDGILKSFAHGNLSVCNELCRSGYRTHCLMKSRRSLSALERRFCMQIQSLSRRRRLPSIIKVL